MTTNQTIDGVSRELIEKAMLACFEAGFGISHAELRALLDSEPCAKSQAEPDPMLCKFYDVTDWPGLVRELVGHVAQLQDSAKRNVKPWEDTFPPTLLPAYVERVNAANSTVLPRSEPVAPWFYFVECDDPDYSGLFNHESEAQTQANDHGGKVVKLWNVPPTWKPAAQPQGEPVAWQYRVSAGPQTGWSLWHDGKGEEFKQSYQVETRPLYAEQPAPVAVVLPERKHHVHQGLSHTDAKADGWNACIDEVNRLNTPQ